MATLVLGSHGFLGRRAVRTLKRKGTDVIGLARTAGADIELDLRDVSGLQRVLDDLRPTAVVNCAARVDFSEGTLAALYPVNVLVPGVVAHWARARGAYVAQVGTAVVHGSRTERIGPCNPIAIDTDYGRSKWLADELILASGCRASILRLGGIYGIGGPPHLGLNRAISASLLGQPPTLSGSGSAQRNYIHVDDAANTLAFLVERELEGIQYAAGTMHSMSDYLRAVRDVLLPGAKIHRADGPMGKDQIIERSSGLPEPRSPWNALRDESREQPVG